MRRNAGFTLIEILVVIAIIAAILGGISLMIRGAAESKMKFDCKARVLNLGAAIERLSTPESLGMLPPSRVDQLRGPGQMGEIGKVLGNGGNDTNCGIEAVYVAVRLKGANVEVVGFDGEGSIANLDNDKAASTPPGMANSELFEYLDPWGRPFVYINSKDYKDMKKLERYVLGEGQEVKVGPRKLTNGEFARPTSFQLFSLGPDAIPDTDDDIRYGE